MKQVLFTTFLLFVVLHVAAKELIPVPIPEDLDLAPFFKETKEQRQELHARFLIPKTTGRFPFKLPELAKVILFYYSKIFMY